MHEAAAEYRLKSKAKEAALKGCKLILRQPFDMQPGKDN